MARFTDTDTGQKRWQYFKQLNSAGAVVDPVAETPVSTATLTAVASAATSAQALAATSTRKGLTAFNTDANGCYLKYGTTASATSFTVLIPSNGYWEMPLPVYTGRIDVIWAADGAGSLYLTEL
jgi:hypothetical protein